MEGSIFLFDYVEKLFYKVNKLSPNCGGSCINFPNLLENKKATKNSKNKDNVCFKYAVTATLNHENIGKHQERVSRLKRLNPI